MSKKANGKADPTAQVVIKKYANRRLYNTETSSYVTLDDLAEMVRAERDFIVFDAKSGDDLTHSVLTQIIVEQESRPGNNPMLTTPFLRQLIRFYGQSIEHMVPSYLQVSLDTLSKERERFGQQWADAFGSPFEMYQEQARKNLAMFEQAVSMFQPFGANGQAAGAAGEANNGAGTAPKAAAKANGSAEPAAAGDAKSKAADELETMRAQLAAMQHQLEAMVAAKRSD
ncbi:MAG: polyhydroxyalkanoate synthesis repressor PhaR [Pseudomonadota bacterium]